MEASHGYHKDYFVTVVSDVVGSDGIPDVIEIGDVIKVKDETLKANYIFATQCFETLEWNGQILCRKGQISCVIVKRPEDRPTDEKRDRLWLNVNDCEPLE